MTCNLTFEIQKDKMCLANQGQSLLSSVTDFFMLNLLKQPEVLLWSNTGAMWLIEEYSAYIEFVATSAGQTWSSLSE